MYTQWYENYLKYIAQYPGIYNMALILSTVCFLNKKHYSVNLKVCNPNLLKNVNKNEFHTYRVPHYTNPFCGFELLNPKAVFLPPITVRH